LGKGRDNLIGLMFGGEGGRRKREKKTEFKYRERLISPG